MCCPHWEACKTIAVILSDKSTSVTVAVKTGNNAAATLTVPANGCAEFRFSDLTRITSDVPIAVAQYTTGADKPSMMWVNPTGQRVTTVGLARFNDWTSYVTILTREQDFDNTRLPWTAYPNLSPP
jgi:hypothetical protein